MIKNMKSIVLVLTLLAVSNVQAAPDVGRDEFFMVTQQMMSMPCNIPAYMKCLGKEQTSCQKAVNSSISHCKKNVKVPASIPRKDIAVVMGKYGECMTGQIKQNLKLELDKMRQCETILSEHAKPMQQKK